MLHKGPGLAEAMRQEWRAKAGGMPCEQCGVPVEKGSSGRMLEMADGEPEAVHTDRRCRMARMDRDIEQMTFHVERMREMGWLK